jgi:hypothetical protein
VRRFNSSVKNSTNTMPIKKNQDVAEKGGKKDQAVHQKEDKPSKEVECCWKEREEAGNL